MTFLHPSAARTLHASLTLLWFALLPGIAGAIDRPQRAVFPGKQWRTCKPAAVDLDGKKLDELARLIGGDGVVVRDGYLVKTWGKPARRGDWASSCKPVMSTLLLFAVQEKRLSGVDVLVRPWVRKRWPKKDLAEKDRTMTFRHLANMTSGYARAEAPGTHWAYNDYAMSLYRHALEEVLGTSLNRAALERLAPLQFEDGALFGSRGGAGVETSPRDFARIGWLWLNRGAWDGKQILAEDLFSRHCKLDVPRDLPRTREAGRDYLGIGTIGGGSDQDFPGQGVYGFNWWFNASRPGQDKRLLPHLPGDAFYALGHDGREVVLVVPSWQLVVAARGNWGGKQLARTRVLADVIRPR